MDKTVDCDVCEARPAEFHLPSDDDPGVTCHICTVCLEEMFNRVVAEGLPSPAAHQTN
jgi:hypothetical protein